VALEQFWVAEKSFFQHGLWAGGSIFEVARIEGEIFKTMKQAEAHGLQLAKDWEKEMLGSLIAGLLVLTSVLLVKRGRTNICRRCRSRIRRWVVHCPVCGAKQD
jgi:hypothetical protein